MMESKGCRRSTTSVKEISIPVQRAENRRFGIPRKKHEVDLKKKT